MFKSYHKIFIGLIVLSSISFSSNSVSRTYENGKKVIDGGVTYPLKKGKRSLYYINTQKDLQKIKFGREATKNEIKAWDIDVMPDGTGLPEGKGSVEEGDEIYETKCASCHFDFGTGGNGYPALQEGNAYEGQKTLKNQRLNPNDEGPIRNFGTYWPRASTLWWYIKTGMPHTKTMTLTNDEVYALVAYILSINEINIDGEELDDDYILDRTKFLKIKMPNKDGFIPKIDGKYGLENVRKFYNNPKNFGGNKKRCMKNCFKGEIKVARIVGNGINDFSPPLSSKKEKQKRKENIDPKLKIKKIYEKSCSICHKDDSMGAPAVGDKKNWKEVLKKGKETVYLNAINGINGMPPKGGSSLNEKEFKKVIDYMIDMSK